VSISIEKRKLLFLFCVLVPQITGGTIGDFSMPITASDGIASYYPEFPGFGEFREGGDTVKRNNGTTE